MYDAISPIAQNTGSTILESVNNGETPVWMADGGIEHVKTGAQPQTEKTETH
jgi:hypothetical protein